MYYAEISKTVGIFFVGLLLMLLLPFGFSLYIDFFADPSHYPEPSATKGFLFTILITFFLTLFFLFFGKKSQGYLYRKEGLISVALIWLLAPLIAGLPFFLSGTFDHFYESYFEATSGLTTTGASVMYPKKFDARGGEIPYVRRVSYELETNYQFYGTINPVRSESGEIVKEGIEAVNKAILLWRSFIQWLGGLGIVVLFVAVLPLLGVGGKLLYQNEMAGPIKEGLTPRIKETAIHLWRIYLILTILEVGALLVTNPQLDLFNALSITFSTISTGGFSVINGSIGGYSNAMTEWVVILFMILGGVNFSLYFFMLRGKFFRLYDPELAVYLIVIILASTYAASMIVGEPLYDTNDHVGALIKIPDAIRQGTFQIVSAVTSTGFATANYDKWPYPVQTLMLILVFFGGMAGSTSGGLKVIRSMILFKTAQNKIELIYRPETVRPFRIGERVIDTSVAMTTLIFFLTLIAISILGTFLLILDGLDPETALTVIGSMINNSGLGFREAGPTDTFAFLSPFSQYMTSIWMILGRLEFFTLLAILVPAFWQEN